MCSGRKGRSPGCLDGAYLHFWQIDLVTHGRALEPVLRYCDKESKTVKDKKKGFRAFKDTVSKIAGEINRIDTPLNVVVKEPLRMFIDLGDRVLFHGPAAALTKEFQTWLESGNDHLGRLFEGGLAMMNHRGQSHVLDCAIQYCLNHLVPSEYTNPQKYQPPVHTISKCTKCNTDKNLQSKDSASRPSVTATRAR